MPVTRFPFKILFAFFLLFSLGCARHELESAPYSKSAKATQIPPESNEFKLFEAAVKDQNKIEMKKWGDKLGWDAVLSNSLRPLDIAISFRLIKSLRFLRLQGAKLELVKMDGVPVLAWAESLPSTEAALKVAILVDLQAEAQEVEALVQKNDYKNLKAKLDQGFDLNLPFAGTGETPLTLALKKNAQLSLRALFLMSDLDVNLANAAGEKPLALARLQNNKKVEEELKKRGATL